MKKYTLLAIILLILGLAYYGISPLFRNKKVNDMLPTSTSTLKESKPSLVVGTPGHPASGTVKIIQTENENYIRYENFKTINGPDIYVYLAKDTAAKEFINLGHVKATEGNINYLIPAGTNLAEYSYVLTWCKTFGVLFNQAQLSQKE